MTLLEELKRTETLQGEELDNALLDIRSKYPTEEDKRIMTEYMKGNLAAIRKDLHELREDIQAFSLKQQMGELYDILPLSYIAEKYFQKSRAWLYQRLNGYKVHGKECTLSTEEKKTFNMATKEISERIGSMQLV